MRFGIGITMMVACTGVHDDDATPEGGDISSLIPDGAATGGRPSLGPEPPVRAIAVTSRNRLLAFDPAAPAAAIAIAPQGLAPGERVLAIDVRPSDRTLYALTTADMLYRVTPAGAFVPHATVRGVEGTAEMDFDPVLDRLHVVTPDGRLAIDPDTGVARTEPVIDRFGAIAFTNAFARACRTVERGVDAVAFDIATDANGNNEGFTVTGASELHAIDLAGGSTLLGTFALAGTEAIVGLAVPSAADARQVPGAIIGLTEDRRLVTFEQSPAKSCTDVAITGIAGDVIGLDARPSTGRLYAVSSAGSIHEVDPITGIASPGVAIDTPLAGSQFGVAFDPTGSVPLVITSDAGLNLRVDVETGVAIAEAPLAARALAFTDQVPSALAAQRFAITGDRLRTGTTEVALGVTGDRVSLEIDGRDNTALLAVDTTLHALDLATGATTPLGTISAGPLRGLTRRPPATEVFGLGIGNLLLRVSLTSQTTTPLGVVKGLLPGDELVSLDVHPATGALYGIGIRGRIYELDPATATATRTEVMVRDPLDTSFAFTSLFGPEVAVDFAPSGRLDVIDPTRRRTYFLADVTSSGVTTFEGLPTVAEDVMVSAISFAPDGVMYGIDTSLQRLVATTAPQRGRVRAIGSLGPTEFVERFSRAFFDTIDNERGVVVGFDNHLREVDLRTGATTDRGFVGREVSALTVAPDGRLITESDGKLFAFVRTTPGQVQLLGTITIPANEHVIALDVHPVTRELWAITYVDPGFVTNVYDARLYTLDATGGATLRGTLTAAPGDFYAGINGGRFMGMSFHPDGSLRIVEDGIFGSPHHNLLVDVATATVVTHVDLDSVPNVGAIAYDRAGTAFALDLGLASLARRDVTQPVVTTDSYSTVGPLSRSLLLVDTAVISTRSSFDIAGGNNGISAATLQLPGEAFSRAYAIDLATGAATELGPIAGPPIRGLAIRIR